MPPELLVVVRASPLLERTSALLATLVSQEPAGLVRTVVLSPRPKGSVQALVGKRGVEEVPAEADWLAQAFQLVRESGCRLVVFPSSLDRYLPDAFRGIANFPLEKGRSIVAPCYIRRDGQMLHLGPRPFRFDYFSLLTGFNYIAPGATFIDARMFLDVGGFDARFPNAAVLEYLLRTGAGNGVAVYGRSLMETQADPFPGVPPEFAPLYAVEATGISLNYHRFVSPGAALGLVAVLAGCLRPMEYSGYYDERMTGLLSAGLVDFKNRYMARLGVYDAYPRAGPESMTAEQREAPDSERPGELAPGPRDRESLWLRLRSRMKLMTPAPVWNLLRRSKRACKAFLEPLY